MEYVICHYAEIGLKGKNRKFFEETLIRNIKQVLPAGSFEFVKRISGRLIIKLTPQVKEKEITIGLKKVFGIAYFSFAVSCGQKIEEIKKQALALLKDKKFKSFRITTQRSKKEFKLNSQEINEKVGEHIFKELKKEVNLSKPNITCFIEIVENFTFLYLKKIKGLGGLPTGVSSKAVVLLSGGIDSPVAAFEIMSRGVRVIFIHFHSIPFTSQASIEKTEDLVKVLNKYQGKSKIYMIPFAEIQKEISVKTDAKLRIILYRRFMMRIAQEIAKKEGALALVTGDSIGQVASQTLENINVVSRVTQLPIFRPLIGLDKEEIIKKAEKIETFKISILPHQDCCVRFLPKHPETRAKLEEVEAAEKKLDIKKLISEAVRNIEIKQVVV